MIASLLRKLLPPKPVVDDRYRSEMQGNRSYAVTSRRESQRTLRQIEVTKEQLRANQVEAAYLRKRFEGATND